jgi:hypothetical protein
MRLRKGEPPSGAHVATAQGTRNEILIDLLVLRFLLGMIFPFQKFSSGRKLTRFASPLSVLFFFFFSTRAWTQGLHQSHSTSPFFVKGFFWDRVSWTICTGWFQAAILLISASWVARIAGVSYQHLALCSYFSEVTPCSPVFHFFLPVLLCICI